MGLRIEPIGEGFHDFDSLNKFHRSLLIHRKGRGARGRRFAGAADRSTPTMGKEVFPSAAVIVVVAHRPAVTARARPRSRRTASRVRARRNGPPQIPTESSPPKKMTA